MDSVYYDPPLMVEEVPELNASVVISTDSSQVFREQGDILPITLFDDVQIMPWGANNDMPFKVLDKIDSDETMSTCMDFITEVTYARGLEYKQKEGEPLYANRYPGLGDFLCANKIKNIFFGQCADLKTFDFCVTVIILDKERKKIEKIVRKNAAYCRFAPADYRGNIPYLVYANWRQPVNKDNAEVITLLSQEDEICSLRDMVKRNPSQRKYAVLSKVPKATSTYYPIPSYASIFKGSWYDIKSLIGTAKKAKLKNSAPLKYHIEVAQGYWEKALRNEGITTPAEAKQFIAKLKKQMIDFLSGAENSGKVLFSSIMVSPDGKEIPEIKVTKISEEKEGGDYTTDIQEAVNMICFAMRVHSNLVGSVPGKSQSNNSGSDKRELYTIAQLLQKPYRDIIFEVHRLVCRFNGWGGLEPSVDIIQLTTLDQHKDAKSNNI